MNKLILLTLAALISLPAAAKGNGHDHRDHDDSDSDKVKVCHIPPGNPENRHTISVSEHAVEAHLLHGDFLGECDTSSEGEGEGEGETGCTDDSDCGDSVFCNGVELCSDGVCTAGDEPCSDTEVCVEEESLCYEPQPPECEEDLDCDDGLFCNGQELCVDEECFSGDAPCENVCDEGCDVCVDFEEDCSDGLDNDLDLGIDCLDSDCLNSTNCNSGEGEGEGDVGEGEGEGEGETVGCELDKDCEDFLFCNGREVCLNKSCFSTEAPCVDGLCSESDNVCLDNGPNTPAKNTREDLVVSGSHLLSCSNTNGSGVFMSALILFGLLFSRFKRNLMHIGAAVVLFAAMPASADGINRLVLEPGDEDMLVTPAPQTVGLEKYSTRLLLDYSLNPLVARNAADMSIVTRDVSHMVQGQVVGTMGVLDNLDLSLGLPVAAMTTDSSGFVLAPGDLRLGAKMMLGSSGPVAMALKLGGTLPTSMLSLTTNSGIVGEKLPTLQPSFVVGYSDDTFKLFSELGGNLRFQRSVLFQNFGSELTLSLGGEAELVEDTLSIFGDVLGSLSHPLPSPLDIVGSDRLSAPAEAFVGMKYSLQALETNVNVLAGLGTAIVYDFGTSPVKAFVGLQFSLPEAKVVSKDVPKEDPVAPPQNQPAPPAEPEPPLAQIVGEQIVTLNPVFFAFDKDVILEESFPTLEAVAEVILTHPELLKISVDGHTDSVGTRTYNNDLSSRRVRSVVKFLVDKGVKEDRLVPRHFGEDKPVVENNSPQNRAKNRRVEFLISERETK